MRFTSSVVLAVVLTTAQLFAQQSDDTAQRVRNANRKITIGLVLMGAGALAAPLTALAHRQGDTGGPAMNASIGMIVVGSGVMWWGATGRNRALQPQTAIGVDLGRTVGVRVRHSW